MTYYELKPEYDQMTVNQYSLIAMELKTQKELSRLKFPEELRDKYFLKTKVSNRKIYWFFGARFNINKNEKSNN